ncbi:glycosyltransferase family protein [Vibrio alginolyticus]|uniref:hypothetical protein n=1 Tax=Vibrio alginolyticus TaxID=663 RepID=UPI0037550E72
MKKVLIFEISSKNHAIMIYNWVLICKSRYYNCNVLTTREIYEQVKSKIDELNFDFNIYFIEDLSNLEKVSLIRSMESLVVTSFQNRFHYYIPLLFCKSRVFITIHNVNRWFGRAQIQSLKGMIKSFYRKLFLYRADGFIVNSKNMLDSIPKDFIHKTAVVPFSLYQKERPLDSCREKVIVYPGMVTKKRKDYRIFLSLAERNPDMKFVLLGKVINNEGGRDIINEIHSKNLNVVFFEKFVDDKVFSDYMQIASLIFADIPSDVILDGYKEIYGVTKDSGVSYLSSEYNLPLLVNSSFKNLPQLRSLTSYYSDVYEADFEIKKLLSLDNIRFQNLEQRKELLCSSQWNLILKLIEGN